MNWSECSGSRAQFGREEEGDGKGVLDSGECLEIYGQL